MGNKKGKGKNQSTVGSQMQLTFGGAHTQGEPSRDKETKALASASKLIQHDFRSDIYRSILNREMQ